MKTPVICCIVIVTAATARPCFAAQTKLSVSAKNNLSIARSSETVELQWAELKAALPTLHPRRVRVTDAATGEDVRRQVVDEDGDGAPDQLIFQGDFQPGETRTFVVEAAPDWQPEPASAVHCGYYDLRGVARHGKVTDEDDFAWENDRIAFRLYGPTTAKMFLGSGIDVWSKRVPYPILDKWHDSIKTFHEDHGEGGDFHTIGGTRGCGGVGVWRDGKLHVSGNFVSYQVLANGPIRTLFEVRYDSWDAAGLKVAETKRIGLDAGQQLSRHEITFQCEGRGPVQYAVGLGKLAEANVSGSKKFRRLALWAPVNTDPERNGEFGLGVVVVGDRPVEIVSTDEPWPFAVVPGHELIIAEFEPGKPAVHYCGAAWSKWGGISNAKDWFDYLDRFAQKLNSPLEITIK